MSIIKDIIKDLYYGKIRPWETAVIPDSDYYNLSKQCSELTDKLTHILDNNGKDILDKLILAQTNLTELSALENFSMGFKLGIQLMTAACEAKSKNFNHED